MHGNISSSITELGGKFLNFDEVDFSWPIIKYLTLPVVILHSLSVKLLIFLVGHIRISDFILPVLSLFALVRGSIIQIWFKVEVKLLLSG